MYNYDIESNAKSDEEYDEEPYEECDEESLIMADIMDGIYFGLLVGGGCWLVYGCFIIGGYLIDPY